MTDPTEIRAARKENSPPSALAAFGRAFSANLSV
jgi:hypothetical protein